MPASRGVTIPVNQGAPANEGPANTVIGAMYARTILVEYFDQNGRRVHDAIMEANGQYIRPDNSEAWVRSFRSVSDWLSKGVVKLLPVDNDKVNIDDNVDVVALENPSE